MEGVGTVYSRYCSGTALLLLWYCSATSRVVAKQYQSSKGPVLRK